MRKLCQPLGVWSRDNMKRVPRHAPTVARLEDHGWPYLYYVGRRGCPSETGGSQKVVRRKMFAIVLLGQLVIAPQHGVVAFFRSAVALPPVLHRRVVAILSASAASQISWRRLSRPRVEIVEELRLVAISGTSRSCNMDVYLCYRSASHLFS